MSFNFAKNYPVRRTAIEVSRAPIKNDEGEKVAKGFIAFRSSQDTKDIIFAANGRARTALPFTPLSLAFKHLNYYVDMPAVSRDIEIEREREREREVFFGTRDKLLFNQEMKKQGVEEARLHLLCDVSGAFRPGILTALVGVSGAGKTTLLDVLAGRKTGGYVEGSIHISGYPKNPETFARVSGYCEQNDIHSPNITVYEALLFSAWLRLPRDVDPDTRQVKILILFLFNSFSFTLPNPNIKFGINFYITRTMLRFNSFVWKKIGCLRVVGNRLLSIRKRLTFYYDEQKTMKIFNFFFRENKKKKKTQLHLKFLKFSLIFQRFVEEVMELIELGPQRNTLTGLPGVNGLSTEQRKRFTVAVELVANPAIIFMDEPTSGLDGGAAAVVLRTVRNIANMWRTVVCTIHQPSTEIFESFDEVFVRLIRSLIFVCGPIFF